MAPAVRLWRGGSISYSSMRFCKPFTARAHVQDTQTRIAKLCEYFGSDRNTFDETEFFGSIHEFCGMFNATHQQLKAKEEKKAKQLRLEAKRSRRLQFREDGLPGPEGGTSPLSAREGSMFSASGREASTLSAYDSTIFDLGTPRTSGPPISPRDGTPTPQRSPRGGTPQRSPRDGTPRSPRDGSPRDSSPKASPRAPHNDTTEAAAEPPETRQEPSQLRSPISFWRRRAGN